MKSIHLVFPGKPLVWSRPRVCRRANQVVMFDPKADKRQWLALTIKGQFPEPLEGPIRLEVVAYYRSLNKKRIGAYKDTKPDGDNLVKHVMDMLNRVAYRDDAQVASISVMKKWGEQDETHIFLSTL